MKRLLISFLSLPLFTSNAEQARVSQPAGTVICRFPNAAGEPGMLRFQDGTGTGKMSCIAFKNQEFCRAELKDFEFNAKFSVVSATVYFSGANFRGVEKGAISSSDLKPIKHLMQRCQPGSNVVFDDVKVKGPDNEVRTITGLSLSLF